MPPYVLLLGTLAASAVFGVLWSRRDGRTRAVPDTAEARLSPEDLAALGIASTGRRVLGEVAEMVDGVTYAEVDAESNLDAMRRFHVLRTPTVLVLDADRRVVVRASGQPRKADVLAAVGRAVRVGSA
jgi:hypothetical protein